MQTAKQISAFLVNKPGRLAAICSALAKEKINIHALTVMDSQEQSVLRLVTDDIARTKEVMNRLGSPFTETEVLRVEMQNRPGALARVCERLGAEHVNIDYAYCSAGTKNGKTLGIFKVSSLPKALKVLAERNHVTRREQPTRRPTFSR